MAIARVVRRQRLGEPDRNRSYWQSRPPAERLAHLQQLRADYFG